MSSMQKSLYKSRRSSLVVILNRTSGHGMTGMVSGNKRISSIFLKQIVHVDIETSIAVVGAESLAVVD